MTEVKNKPISLETLNLVYDKLDEAKVNKENISYKNGILLIYYHYI